MIEGFNKYRSRVGMDLRINNVFNTRSDAVAINRYCDGIGEGNPRYRDDDYPGGRIAPPSFVMSVFPGWILQGLPGMHVFHTSTDFTFYKPIPVGVDIMPKSRFTGFRQLSGKLGKVNILEFQEAGWYGADEKPFATAKVTGIRTKRDEARDADIYQSIKLPHPWTERELAALEEKILSEKPRGAETLYIEDVVVGEKLPKLTIGPLGITDIIAYCIGASPVHLKAHGLALEDFRRHPAWAFRDGDGHTLEPMFGVHYSKAAAEFAGMPCPFDIGSQRHAWLIRMLTNWMSDRGFLRRCEAKFTGFVFLSDVVTISGSVRKLKIEDGIGMVTISASAHNQRGEEIMKGVSEVLLPLKGDPGTVERYIHGGN